MIVRYVQDALNDTVRLHPFDVSPYCQARRDIERAQLELDEKKEELRLQKEREQLHKR